MEKDVKIIHVLEKAVVLGVTSIAWSFLCYLMVLAYSKTEWITLIVLLLGLISLLFVFIQGVIEVADTYSELLYKKFGTLRSGLICIAFAYMILLPPSYTLLSIF